MKKNANITVKKILKNKTIQLEDFQIPFVKSFLKTLLVEQGESEEEPIPSSNNSEFSPDSFTPEKNQEDFEKSFKNPTVDSKKFDIEGVSPKIKQQNIEQIRTWADKLDEFANFLNDPDKGTSLHRILADSDHPGSLLRGVTRKASDSITRIAGEVEKLKEVLNTFIITAPKKLRDSENTTNPL
jgi:hypothetical protein